MVLLKSVAPVLRSSTRGQLFLHRNSLKLSPAFGIVQYRCRQAARLANLFVHVASSGSKSEPAPHCDTVMMMHGQGVGLRTVWQVHLDGGWVDFDPDECRMFEVAFAASEETL